MANYLDSGWNRLATAILLKAIDDFKLAAKAYKRALEKKNMRDAEDQIREMREIVSFILSDWFVYLTQSNCPQEETIYKLMELVDKSHHEEILKGLIKEKKNKSDSLNKVKKMVK